MEGELEAEGARWERAFLQGIAIARAAKHKTPEAYMWKIRQRLRGAGLTRGEAKHYAERIRELVQAEGQA